MRGCSLEFFFLVRHRHTGTTRRRGRSPPLSAADADAVTLRRSGHRTAVACSYSVSLTRRDKARADRRRVSPTPAISPVRARVAAVAVARASTSAPRRPVGSLAIRATVMITSIVNHGLRLLGLGYWRVGASGTRDETGAGVKRRKKNVFALSLALSLSLSLSSFQPRRTERLLPLPEYHPTVRGPVLIFHEKTEYVSKPNSNCRMNGTETS